MHIAITVASGTNKGEGLEILQIRKQLVGKCDMTSSHSVGSEDCGVLCGDCSRQSVCNIIPATKPGVGFQVIRYMISLQKLSSYLGFCEGQQIDSRTLLMGVTIFPLALLMFGDRFR